jgi:HK97 family phage portal protein
VREAEEYAAHYFANASNPGGMITFKEPPFKDSAARNKWLKDFEERHMGAHNNGRLALVAGDASFVPFSVKPEDAQLLMSRRFNIQEICRIFDIPPMLLGDMSDMNLTNAPALDRFFLKYCLRSRLRQLQKEFTRKLFTGAEKGRFFVKFNTSAFLQADDSARALFYEKMFGLGIYTQNHILRLEDMNPIGEEGDKRYITVQVQSDNNNTLVEEPLS